MKKHIHIIEEDGKEIERHEWAEVTGTPWKPGVQPFQPTPWKVGPYTVSTDPCDGCSNNPKNGGSGQCCCSIPYLSRTSYTIG